MAKRIQKHMIAGLIAGGTALLLSIPAHAAADDVVNAIFGENANTLDIILLMTVLMLLPSLLICLTSFTRSIIVLSFVRNAIGVQNAPPNQVLVGLALFLTYFIMNPVFMEIKDTAYTPYVEEQITRQEFLDRSMVPLRGFMLEQTYKSDLDFFARLDHIEEAERIEEIPNRVVIPAFITSELKRAFQIGFFIFIPFIVIDMVVASTLMSMGMMMLPPAMISLPFKILLFVLIDGWQLTLGTLIKSFM